MAQEDESGWVAPSDDPGDGEAPDGGGDSPVDAPVEPPKEPPLPPLRNEPLDLPPGEPFTDDEEIPPEPPDMRAKEDARAQRMIAKMREAGWYEGPLPPDIEEVWGRGVLDGSALPAENTARSLIGAWGLDAFRESALHRVALTERESEERMAPIRKAFVEAQKKAAKR